MYVMYGVYVCIMCMYVSGLWVLASWQATADHRAGAALISMHMPDPCNTPSAVVSKGSVHQTRVYNYVMWSECIFVMVATRTHGHTHRDGGGVPSGYSL